MLPLPVVSAVAVAVFSPSCEAIERMLSWFDSESTSMVTLPADSRANRLETFDVN